jgi:putative transposase
VKYAFVERQSPHHSVTALCRSMQVTRSGYYDWLQCQRQPSARSQRDAVLLKAIQGVHQQHRGAYGALKTWKHLSALGYEGGKHRVARLRAAAGIEAKRKRRFRVTVQHHHSAESSPDLLNRQFCAAAPDKVWVGDMTFVRTRQGWLHLAMLLDVYSRLVVGWAMGDSPNSALHEAALLMALEQRQPAKGLIHHTDRGMLYRTGSYRALLNQAGMRQSMSGRKSAYDNAMAESFFSNLKNELVNHCDYATREQAKCSIFDYIELFYNRHRIHQSLGYQTPAQVEASYHASNP